MKFIVDNKIVELNKADLMKLEYHCCDVDQHHSPYLLIFTKTSDPVRVNYATEFRAIYEYFRRNKLEIKNY